VVKTKLIVNLTRGDALCMGKLADSPLPRMRGLMGSRGLPAGEGLLLTPAPAIHTAFMRFPIDALFLDRNMRVLEIVERLRPWRIASQRKARAVLELAAGESARRGVVVGDMLELREPSDGDAEIAAIANGVTETVGLDEIVGACSQSDGPTRVQPLRALVVSPDRHFRTVISLLLARRNCAVSTSASAARLRELVVHEAVGVVIIDVSDAGSATTVAAVEAIGRPTGIVLVADEEHSASDARVLAKWGPFRDFVAAVELANEGRCSPERLS
jgi:uncharacterized membrane protein (UPF0127 family)